MSNQDKILYGKNELKRVVGIEVNENIAEVFIQKEDGSVESEILSHKYWCLSPKPINRHAKRLSGDLHYKWGYQFDDLNTYLAFRKINYSSDLYTLGNHVEAMMIKDGITFYGDMEPKEVSILSFDIETTGIVHDETSKVLLISNTYRNKDKIVRRLFCYDDYSNTKEFIEAWTAWVRQIDPSIICGHNIVSFDIPYLDYLASMNGTSLDLGRDESAVRFHEKESKFRVDGTRDLHYKKCFIYGRQIVDTMFLAYKSDVGKKYESYGLKQIIKQEGLERTDRQFYDASTIRYNYKDPIEWKKIKEYAEHDADDSLALFDKLIPPFFEMGKMIPKPFQLLMETASGSQINSLLCRAYLQDKHSLPKADDIKGIKGGISLGNPGIYKHCKKIDIASSYPSAILINKLYSKKKDPNAYMYEICKVLTYKRLEYKKLYAETGEERYKHLDQSAKVFINSLFGFLSAPGLNFNDSEISGLITHYGREYLGIAIKWATSKETDYWVNKLSESTKEESVDHE